MDADYRKSSFGAPVFRVLRRMFPRFLFSRVLALAALIRETFHFRETFTTAHQGCCCVAAHVDIFPVPTDRRRQPVSRVEISRIFDI